MKKNKGFGAVVVLAAVAIIAILVFLFATGGESDKDSGGAALQVLGHAKKLADESKVRVVKTAITRFKLDNGRLPESLDELIEKDYVTEAKITDSKGDTFGYENGEVWIEQEDGVQKQCGKCKKSVDPESAPGEKCPHCGIVWKQQTSLVK